MAVAVVFFASGCSVFKSSKCDCPKWSHEQEDPIGSEVISQIHMETENTSCTKDI